MKLKISLLLSVLLLASCGVSSSKQEQMTEDFCNKFTALYLVPDAPGMVEEVEVYDIEKTDGAYRAMFSATHVGDGGRAYIVGSVEFDEGGRVVFRDSAHLEVRVLVITATTPKAKDVPCAEWGNYLPSQILY